MKLNPVGAALSAIGLLGVALTSSAAAPTISSAALSNDTLTLSGSNFGSKSTAAPFYFQDFSGLADGANSAAAGLQWTSDTQSNPNTSRVISSDGIGGKALSMTKTASSTDGQDGFSPYLSVTLPANTQGVMVSFWIKFIKTTSGLPSAMYQWKGPRAGIFGTTPSDPTTNYQANPKLSSQTYVRPDGLWPAFPLTDSGGFATGLWTDAPLVLNDIYSHANPSSFNFYSTWIQRDTWLKFNDVGQANGEVNETINGDVIQNLTNLANRTSSGQWLNHVQVFPGLQFLRNKNFEIRVSRISIDTTRARVFLGNAATLSACTGRYIVKPSAWASGSITATHAANAPTGYQWVYVANSAGEINTSGFQLGAATSSKPNPPVIQSVQ